MVKDRVLYRYNDDNTPFYVPWVVVCAPVLLGGYGITPPGYRFKVIAPFTLDVPRSKRKTSHFKQEGLPTEMSKDWVKYVSSRTGGLTIDSDALHDIAAEANYSSVLNRVDVVPRKIRLIEEWYDHMEKNARIHACYPNLSSCLKAIDSPLHALRENLSEIKLCLDVQRSALVVVSSENACRLKVEEMLDVVGSSLKNLRLTNVYVAITQQIHQCLAKTTFKNLTNTLTAFFGKKKEVMAYTG